MKQERRSYVIYRRQIIFMENGRMEKWNGQPIDLTRWVSICLVTLVSVP